MYRLEFAAKAADKLLDKIKELDLSISQKDRLKQAFIDISNDPYIGAEQLIEYPLKADYVYDISIGGGLHLVVLYDIRKSNNADDWIFVKANSIVMKM